MLRMRTQTDLWDNTVLSLLRKKDGGKEMTTLDQVIAAAASSMEKHNDIIGLRDLFLFCTNLKRDGHDPKEIDILTIRLEARDDRT